MDMLVKGEERIRDGQDVKGEVEVGKPVRRR